MKLICPFEINWNGKIQILFKHLVRRYSWRCSWHIISTTGTAETKGSMFVNSFKNSSSQACRFLWQQHAWRTPIIAAMWALLCHYVSELKPLTCCSLIWSRLFIMSNISRRNWVLSNCRGQQRLTLNDRVEWWWTVPEEKAKDEEEWMTIIDNNESNCGDDEVGER